MSLCNRLLTTDSRGKNIQELCNAKAGLNEFVVDIPKETLFGTSPAQPSFGMTLTIKKLPCATGHTGYGQRYYRIQPYGQCHTKKRFG